MSLESAVNLGRRCLQDFYRPRYFILENVRNFVSFKKSVVFTLFALFLSLLQIESALSKFLSCDACKSETA